ncbi:vacuolar membrane protein-domain-containing protein [Sparassis latifolia]
MSDGFFDGYPDVDRRSCRLLGPTALITQGLMGVLVMSSLVYKRHREEPKRPWRIWLFDVSKQVIGQLFVHGVNVLISDVVAHVSSGNACVFYFLNILIDTTLGVGVIYFVLHFITYLLTEKCNFKGFESGQYGSPPSFIYWTRQAAVYLLALLTMKLLVVALFAAWPGIFKVGEWLLTFLGPSDAVQVIFTMGLFPILMNILQFWLIDSIVKGSHASSLALPTDTPRASLDPDNEPLFRADSDDDSDDDMRHDIENPRTRSLSRHRDDALDPATADEPKSLSSETATIVGSGSNTPLPKSVEVPSTPIAVHAYPPSIASTSSTPASSLVSSVSSRTKSMSPKSKPKRVRPMPPPILPLQALPSEPQAIGDVLRDSSVPLSGKPSPGLALRDEEIPNEKDWAAWEENGEDDWVERGPEEDWTGREAKRDAVNDAWTRAYGAVGTES